MNKLRSILVLFTMFCAVSCALEKESPRDYARDVSITTQVKLKLIADTKLKAHEISVETFKGEVQLSGFVSTHEEAFRAEQKTFSVPGVKTVQNDLIVRKTKSYRTNYKANVKKYLSDGSITSSVKLALAADSRVSALEISVTTFNGDVVLSGTLHNHEDAAIAEQIAKKVAGVKSVTNDIKVNKQ